MLRAKFIEIASCRYFHSGEPGDAGKITELEVHCELASYFEEVRDSADRVLCADCWLDKEASISSSRDRSQSAT